MLDLIPDLPFEAKALATLLAILLAGTAVRATLSSKRHLPLPPGPPGHWLFGNILPKEHQSQQFAAWVNQYGPVISLRVGPKVIVIVGRYQESVDILEREGSVLADRPRSVAAGEILSRGLRMILSSATEQFRRLRKAAHTHLQPKAVESYGPIQMREAREVILDLLQDPKRHQAHINRYAASVILRVTYGKSTPTATDAPEVITIHKMLRRFQMLMRPGAMLVDSFPILKYVPFYASYLETWRQEESKLFYDQLGRVAREIDTGKAGPSFTRYLLENQDTHKLSYDEMAYLAGTLFGTGSDTTAIALMVFIMAAACHPEAQTTVQNEIDRVIGRDRGMHLSSPTFDDYTSLPQLDAFILECLRWRPVTNLGFAHCASADITYNGFCIPKGALVFGNHWVISRDPEAYPNPDKFDPQRWLNSDGRVRNDVKYPSFGFGRRACPGQHLANRSLFINGALLLWSFRITQDPNSPIDDTAFVDGVIARPLPFDACFTPRIADKAHLREVMAKYVEDP